MAVIRRNFLTGNTSVLLSAGGTTLTSADLAALPVVAAPDYAWLSLDPLEEHGLPEIVKVTAHSSGSVTATVVRGQQTAEGGGPGREHPSGTFWSHPTTALDLADIETALGVAVLADKKVFVSPRGSDSNDGLTLKTAFLTLAAAKTALAGAAGTIVLGYGDTAVPAQFNIDVVGMVLEGCGYGSNLVVTSAMTSALRVVDAGRCILRDFRLTIGAGGAVTNAILVDTLAGSNETTLLDNLYVATSGGTMTNGVWLGDVAGDTSEVMCTNVRVSGASNAGFKLGTGNSNNVLNMRFYGCDSRSNVYGLEIGGAGCYWGGGTLMGNSGADVKVSSPGSAPITVEGVRSEGSRMFLECNANFTGVGTINLRAIKVRTFTEPAGAVIDHSAALGLILDDFYAVGGPVPVAFAIFGPNSTNKCRLIARNVCTDAANPFGALSNVVATIIGTSREEAVTGKNIDSTVGTRIDGVVTMADGFDSPFGLDFESTFGMHPVVAAALATSSIGVAVANNAQAVRWRPRRSFTVARLLWFVGAVGATGNYDLAILDASLNRLWSKGSTAVPAANATVNVAVVGGPAVVAGQTYYLVLALDNTTDRFLGTTLNSDTIRDRNGDNYNHAVAASFPVPNPLGTLGASTIVPFITVRSV